MGDILKKIFETVGLISLVCFSFFYTNRITTVIKENDDLLKQIEEIQEQYKTEPINAVIEGNTIIPGLSGKMIDIKNSYKKMKKLNKFNANLLVYKDSKPEISVKKVYDKYIISGNKNNKEVSLLFLLDNQDKIDKLLSILDENEIKATFYTDGKWFENNDQTIIDLIEDGHIIGNLGYHFKYDTSGVSWMNTIVTKIGKQRQTYCYNAIEEESTLEYCNLNQSYTIRPSIIVKNNPLIEIKSGLSNGSIISLEVNDTTIKELPLIIDYIASKDLSIVTIEELLNE